MSSAIPFLTERKDIVIAVMAAVLLVVADSEPGVNPILRSDPIFLPDQAPEFLFLVMAFCLYLFCGLVGIFSASRLDLPSWWRPGTDSPHSRQTTTAVVLLGIGIVILNMIINVGSILAASEA